MYSNVEWGLVDALNTNKVNLDDIEAESLPTLMKAMSKGEQLQYIQKKKHARKDIKDQIATLNEARSGYIKEEQNKLTRESTPIMDEAISSAIRTQGEKKEFSFTKK